MTEKQKEITAEEARQVLEAEQTRSLQACNMEVQKALQKHGYELVAVPGLTADGRIVATVQMRPAR